MRRRESKTMFEAGAELNAAVLALGRAARQEQPVKWIIDTMERFLNWLARRMTP